LIEQNQKVPGFFGFLADRRLEVAVVECVVVVEEDTELEEGLALDGVDEDTVEDVVDDTFVSFPSSFTRLDTLRAGG
jgi:hypothetical protein